MYNISIVLIGGMIMRAVISGGGTGGHIYPALAIAEELRARGDEILYMGGADSTEDGIGQRIRIWILPVWRLLLCTVIC